MRDGGIILAQRTIYVSVQAAAADRSNTGTSVELRLVHKLGVDHQATGHREIYRGMTARPCDQRKAVPAGPFDRLSHIMGIQAARDSGRQDRRRPQVVGQRQLGESWITWTQHRS